MDKVLTISIAAFNVERYIKKTLDSLIDEDIIDDLEIFVVDDGGTDGTLTIAQEYAEKYPQSIFPVHKENGGYGSTVNYSIAHASGKYFRILDGDDWLARENLGEFVRRLKDVETDVIISPYYQCEENHSAVKVNTVEHRELDTSLNICDMKILQAYGMWCITYKTEILKKCGLELPLHCLYTDQIFSTIPFATAKTICFINLGIYCYRIGRDGQSVSRESRIKHIGDNKKVVDVLCRFYQEQEAAQNENLRYLLHRISVYAISIIKTNLLSPIAPEVLYDIKQYELELKEKSPQIYKKIGDVFAFKAAVYVRMLRMIGYGKVGLFVSKVIFPKDGIRNWA